MFLAANTFPLRLLASYFAANKLAPLLCLVLALCAPEILQGQGYRLIHAPAQWQFQTATDAYDPETGKKLGEFQPGIRVDVISTDVESDKWLVRYRHFGSPDIQALVDWPTLPQTIAARWPAVERELDQAPLLKRLLSHERPWEQSTEEMVKAYLHTADRVEAGTKEAPLRVIGIKNELDRLWGLRPTFTILDVSNSSTPAIIIEVWNKADGTSSLSTFPGGSPHRAYVQLKEKLEQLCRQLDGMNVTIADSNASTLGIVREQRDTYPLANHTIATLRYQRGEYIILELRPHSRPQENAQTAGINTSGLATRAELLSFQNTLKGNIATKDGYRYLDKIPMIDQGEKGYCVAATLARVLQYYGYSVDMHQMADLASTGGDGTTYRNMVRAMYRTCASTPFKMNRVRTRDIQELQKLSIDRGLPLIWVIPRHVRLVTGFHEDGKSIVYTDTWGPGHEFKTMSISDFKYITVDIFMIDI